MTIFSLQQAEPTGIAIIAAMPGADGNPVDVWVDPSDRIRWPMVKAAVDGGMAIAPYVAPPPSEQEVSLERDRRIGLGVVFQGVLFDASEKSLDRVARKSITASNAMQLIADGVDLKGDYLWGGMLDDPMEWIAADKSFIPMDAVTFVEFAAAMDDHFSRHRVAARKIKNMDPIPGDHTDDRHWP